MEPPPLVVGFVAHHLEMGATQVDIYLDAPDPETQRLLAGVEGCNVVLCDDDFWQAHKNGARPGSINQRQVHNANLSYRSALTDWLIHLDVDEFLHAESPVHEHLSSVPQRIEALRIPNSERAFEAGRPQSHIFDGILRRPFPRGWPEDELVAPDVAPFVRRGLVGHAQGKSMMRTGGGLIPGIHGPRLPKSAGRRVLAVDARSFDIFHFDGLTGLHWAMKLARGWGGGTGPADARGYMSDQRVAQIDYVDRNLGSMGAIYDLHQRLKTVTAEDIRHLESMGLVCHGQIDPEHSLDRIGLAGVVDFSIDAFDAYLQGWEIFSRMRVAQWYRRERRYAQGRVYA